MTTIPPAPSTIPEPDSVTVSDADVFAFTATFQTALSRGRASVRSVRDPRGFDEYIGRANPRTHRAKSLWANPYPLAPGATLEGRMACLARYRAYVLAHPELRAALAAGALRGKTLGCFCKFWRGADCVDPFYKNATGSAPGNPHGRDSDLPCHGDVLDELQELLYEPAKK